MSALLFPVAVDNIFTRHFYLWRALYFPCVCQCYDVIAHMHIFRLSVCYVTRPPAALWWKMMRGLMTEQVISFLHHFSNWCFYFCESLHVCIPCVSAVQRVITLIQNKKFCKKNLGMLFLVQFTWSILIKYWTKDASLIRLHCIILITQMRYRHR